MKIVKYCFLCTHYDHFNEFCILDESNSIGFDKDCFYPSKFYLRAIIDELPKKIRDKISDLSVEEFVDLFFKIPAKSDKPSPNNLI